MNRMFLNPHRYVERYYWSLKEVLAGGNPENEYPDYLYNVETLYPVIGYMVSEGYSTPIWDTEDEEIKEEYRPVLELVVKRFLEHYCFWTTSSEANEEFTTLCCNFMAKIINVLIMTAPRYLKLLEVYSGADASLMSPVEITSTGLTRFNDTPQDEGDFANDEHTTNLTEDNRTTSNDIDTKMGRIREIEGNYNNILLKWSNEFDKLFLEESNI